MPDRFLRSDGVGALEPARPRSIGLCSTAWITRFGDRTQFECRLGALLVVRAAAARLGRHHHHVANLRRKLGDIPEHPRFIETVRAGIEWAIANQAVIALQNARLYSDLEQEKERMLEIQDEARKKLARDLRAQQEPPAGIRYSAPSAMTGYFIRRLLLIIPTFIGITAAVFVVMQFVPGGPVERQIARTGTRMTRTPFSTASRVCIPRNACGTRPDG